MAFSHQVPFHPSTWSRRVYSSEIELAINTISEYARIYNNDLPKLISDFYSNHLQGVCYWKNEATVLLATRKQFSAGV